MVFFGVLAAGFYTFVLGAVWPPRDGASAVEALIGLIGKSLLLSWLVVVVSYWLDLPDLLLPLFAVVAASVVLQARFAERSLTDMAILAVCAAAVLLPCVALVFGGFGSDYRSIFVTNDAILSWNRWAIELAGNDYHPYVGGPYPLLFPGLWSLVYKAQGTSDVWIAAKATLLVVPALLVLLVFLLIARRLYLHAAALGAFIGFFFFLGHAFPMLLGDMDVPVCAMMLASGVVLYLAATDFAEDRHGEARAMMVLAAIFAGLASITKQWGIVMAMPLLILLGVMLLRGRLSPRAALLVLGLSLAPLLAFLSIYLPLQVGDPFALVARTTQISAQRSVNVFATARDYLLQAYPVPAVVTTGILAAANLLNLRRLVGWLGMVFLLLAVCAFLFYAKCCSYDARNGWSVAILFALSAFFGLDAVRRFIGTAAREESLPPPFPATILPGLLLLLIVIGAAVASLTFSDRHVRLAQTRKQWSVAGNEVGAMIRSNMERFDQASTLLSSNQLVAWLPGVRGHIRLCYALDPTCVDSVFAEPRRFIVLIARDDRIDPRLTGLLLPDKLVGEPDDQLLYGPLDVSGVSLGPSMLTLVASGAELRLRFDPAICSQIELGAFDCNETYRVRYSAAENRWDVIGRAKGTGSVEDNAYDNAPARPGHITLWGMAGLYDRWGSVYVGGTRIAELSPPS